MEKETVFFLSIWKVFHNLSSQFSIFVIDPKEKNINNIENVIQGCGWGAEGGGAVLARTPILFIKWK